MCTINITVQENKEYMSGLVLNIIQQCNISQTRENTGINEVSHLWFFNLVAVMCLIFFRLTVEAEKMQEN